MSEQNSVTIETRIVELNFGEGLSEQDIDNLMFHLYDIKRSKERISQILGYYTSFGIVRVLEPTVTLVETKRGVHINVL